MRKTAKTKKPPISQKQRFIEMARRVGADEDENAFTENLRKIAKAKPAPPPKKN